MASYLVQEADGTSQLTLEDASGSLLLDLSDGSTPDPEPDPETGGGAAWLLQPILFPADGDDEVVAVCLLFS